MKYKVHGVHETTVKIPVTVEGHEIFAEAPALVVEFVPEVYEAEKFDESGMMDAGTSTHEASYTHREVYLDKAARDAALADFKAEGARFTIKIERATP